MAWAMMPGDGIWAPSRRHGLLSPEGGWRGVFGNAATPRRRPQLAMANDGWISSGGHAACAQYARGGRVLGSASGAHSHHSVCRLFESASPDWLIFCLRSSCALLTKIYGSITEVTMWPVQLAGTRVARGRTRLGQSQGFPLTTQCRMRLEHSDRHPHNHPYQAPKLVFINT